VFGEEVLECKESVRGHVKSSVFHEDEKFGEVSRMEDDSGEALVINTDSKKLATDHCNFRILVAKDQIIE